VWGREEKWWPEYYREFFSEDKRVKGKVCLWAVQLKLHDEKE
jgi:hypothetical protein